MRAAGSSAAPSVSSSLNVRRAASGVRSSCETSARKSRLRSRSRRMISTLSWSRSAIALNWTASSASSDEPARTSFGGTRRVRSPSARPRDASVRRRSGVVNRRAMAAETSTLRPSANSAMAASSPVTLASAVARKVYGLARVTSTAYGVKTGSPPENGWSTKTVRSCVCPGHGLGRRAGMTAGRPSRRGRRLALALRDPPAERDRDVGLGELVGDDPLLVRVEELARTRGSTVPSATHDRTVPDRLDRDATGRSR